jgi:DNA invertase Pin-like site-specific DNA recombinase
MTTYIYLRVSGNKQKLSGLGIEAQRERCRAMATVKGWTVIEEFIDNGITGKQETITEASEDRPELDRLLTAIKTQKPVAVIVSSLDRLGRRRAVIEDLVQEIGRHTDLLSCKESFDTTTATGRFVLNLFMDLAELERDQIGERTQEALWALKARGMQYGAIPYGFMRGEPCIKTLRDGTEKQVFALVCNPVEQDIIHRVRLLRAEGLSINGIAKRLTADEIQPRSAGKTINFRGSVQPGSGKWTKTQIARLLDRGAE